MTLKSGIEQAPHERLSDREYQVLCMIASGKTVSEIAEVVHLSITTISTYRARILEKMSMKNNAELTRDAGRVSLTATYCADLSKSSTMPELAADSRLSF